MNKTPNTKNQTPKKYQLQNTKARAAVCAFLELGIWKFVGVWCLVFGVLAASAGEPLVQIIVPGFTVQELPLKISNINNLRFAPNGRLTALGYDGRVHILSDTDGDGLEDKDDLFWDKQTITVPVGMCWAPEGLYIASHGKVSLLRDTNKDWKADEEEIIAQGWPATDVATGGTDAVGLARDPEGNIYFGLLTADYSNPYRIWKDGKVHYSTNDIRGTIQKWSPKTKKLETVCTGIRVPFALEFNQVGDLFNTDQEGETWCPDGNPLDELNHIIAGRNYGFPPRHPTYLPDLVSEPPVVTFGPQHQSGCGLDFNEPRSTLSTPRGLFGRDWWEHNAFVAGESRGKIWRVKLVKTATGYVGRPYLFAQLAMLTTDVRISPKGELYVSCHSGEPDWGTGPKGEGKLFKITYTDASAPQPVLTWAPSATEVRVAFDQPLDNSSAAEQVGGDIEFGHYVSAADRIEKLRPPYQIVKQQQATPRGKIKILAARLSDDKRVLMLDTAPHPQAVTYALTLKSIKTEGSSNPPATIDLDYKLTGVKATWRSKARGGADSWLPHFDSALNEAFTDRSTEHERFSKLVSRLGSLELRSFLALPTGTNFLYCHYNAPFEVIAGRTSVKGTNDGTGVYIAEIKIPIIDQPVETAVRLELVAKPAFHVAYSQQDDSTRRPLPFEFFRLPGAPAVQPPPPLLEEKTELAGGDFERGKELFFGDKLKCATCHKIRGEGKTTAPDLTNLAQRDPAAVRRDIQDPNALINPDYVAFNVSLNNGEELTGFVRAQKEDSLIVLSADGKETIIPRKDVRDVRASTVSLMPSGLLDGMKEEAIRDLLLFLSTEPPKRAPQDIEKIIAGTASPASASTPPPAASTVVWVASKQDHGPGQHDYPVVQKMWVQLLNKTPEIKTTTAWEWPTKEQFAEAAVLVFYFWNHNWSDERLKQVDDFLARGGGIVLIHSATIAKTEYEKVAERFGLASRSGGFTKYIHAPVNLKIVVPESEPLVVGLPKQIRFLDEPYWHLVGDTNRIRILATTEQEGKDWPQVWTFEKAKGRVFATVLGHYTWTHEDPMFQLIILRGIAWSAGKLPHTFDSLAGTRKTTAELSK